MKKLITKKMRKWLNKVGVLSYSSMFVNFVVSVNPLVWLIGMAVVLAVLSLLLINSGGEVVEVDLRPRV